MAHDPRPTRPPSAKITYETTKKTTRPGWAKDLQDAVAEMSEQIAYLKARKTVGGIEVQGPVEDSGRLGPSEDRPPIDVGEPGVGDQIEPKHTEFMDLLERLKTETNRAKVAEELALELYAHLKGDTGEVELPKDAIQGSEGGGFIPKAHEEISEIGGSLGAVVYVLERLMESMTDEDPPSNKAPKSSSPPRGRSGGNLAC